jgi:hypothetical protein
MYCRLKFEFSRISPPITEIIKILIKLFSKFIILQLFPKFSRNDKISPYFLDPKKLMYSFNHDNFKVANQSIKIKEHQLAIQKRTIFKTIDMRSGLQIKN